MLEGNAAAAAAAPAATTTARSIQPDRPQKVSDHRRVVVPRATGTQDGAGHVALLPPRPERRRLPRSHRQDPTKTVVLRVDAVSNGLRRPETTPTHANDAIPPAAASSRVVQPSLALLVAAVATIRRTQEARRVDASAVMGGGRRRRGRSGGRRSTLVAAAIAAAAAAAAAAATIVGRREIQLGFLHNAPATATPLSLPTCCSLR